MIKHNKKLLTAAISLAVAGTAYAAVSNAPLPVETATNAYKDQVSSINLYFSSQGVPLEAQHHKSLMKSDTEVAYITRLTEQGSANTKDCVDLATFVNLNPETLESGTLATTETVIISDKEQSDCEWIGKAENSKHGYVLTEQLNGKIPLNLKTTHSITGNVSSVFTIDEFSLNLKKNNETLKITSSPLTLEAETNLYANKVSGSEVIDYTLDWNGSELDFKGGREDFTAKIGPSASSGKFNRASEFIWTGPMEATLSEVAIFRTNTKDSYSIQGIKLTGNSKNKENIFSEDINFSVDSINVNGNKLGELSYNMNIDGLKIDKLEEMLHLLNTFPEEPYLRVNQEPGASGETTKTIDDQSPEAPATKATAHHVEVMDIHIEEMMNALKGSLSDASISIDPFTFKTKNGQLNFGFKVNFHDLNSLDVETLSFNPLPLLAQLTVEVDNKFNTGLVDDVSTWEFTSPTPQHAQLYKQQLEGAVQQGILTVDKDNNYSINFKMDRGAFFLNGEPVDPSKYSGFIGMPMQASM